MQSTGRLAERMAKSRTARAYVCSSCRRCWKVAVRARAGRDGACTCEKEWQQLGGGRGVAAASGRAVGQLGRAHAYRGALRLLCGVRHVGWRCRDAWGARTGQRALGAFASLPALREWDL